MLILTGFEPFGKFEKNPSWEAVSRIEVDRRVLVPVDFRKSVLIAKEIMLSDPDVVIATGLSPSSDRIRIEALAINLMHSKFGDNSGYAPNNERVIPGGKDCYFTDVPFFDLVDFLNSEGIESRVSFSAGVYVCNSFYYALLHYREAMGNKSKILFVHVPPTKEMDEKIGWDLEKIRDAIERVIEFTSRLSSP